MSIVVWILRRALDLATLPEDEIYIPHIQRKEVMQSGPNEKVQKNKIKKRGKIIGEMRMMRNLCEKKRSF